MIFSRNSYEYDEITNECLIDPNLLDKQGIDMETYNCGGYALNTKTWYHPYKTGKYEEFGDMFDLIDSYGKRKVLRMFVKYMLNDMPNLRLLKNISDLKQFETLVLFRIGDTDFHFVREEDGKYFHKMGWIPRIEEMDEDEVFGESWCDGKYDSDIVLFGLNEN